MQPGSAQTRSAQPGQHTLPEPMYCSNADHVPGPTTPSDGRPAHCWNCRTLRPVFASKLPLTSMIMNHRYEGMKWSLTLIDSLHVLGVLVIHGIVIGLFGPVAAA